MSDEAVWIDEQLYPGYRQSFKLKTMICEMQTRYQHVMLFESESHGKVLMLDHVVQLTQRDEAIYHEMMVHVPMLAHPSPRSVLIVGGGDGGALRRVLMHPQCRAALVEIDAEIIELSKRHLQSIAGNAFDDERVTVVIDDAAHFVATTDQRFDVLIIDRGDPIGPVSSLFERSFYEACKRCLNPGGVMVAQSGVPFMQPAELTDSMAILQQMFAVSACFFVAVPTNVGGNQAFVWASDAIAAELVETAHYRERYSRLLTTYYTPALHRSAFTPPKSLAATLAAEG